MILKTTKSDRDGKKWAIGFHVVNEHGHLRLLYSIAINTITCNMTNKQGDYVFCIFYYAIRMAKYDYKIPTILNSTIPISIYEFSPA